MKQRHEEPDKRIPIILLTGFLGSGKTTILNRLLQHDSMVDTAVIINELGAISIDHDLVAQASGDIVELNNGCLCCTVRSDLVSTLFGLYVGRIEGTVSPFKRVVIETTGLADPGPILLSLFTDEVVARRYRVEGVLTAVDAVNGLATLNREIEASKQAAAADRLLLTKLDLTSPLAAEDLKLQLVKLNPGCPIVEVHSGDVDPSVLKNLGVPSLAGLADKAAALHAWMGLAGERTPDLAAQAAHDHAACHDHLHSSLHDVHIVTHGVFMDEPIVWESLVAWINALRKFKGPNLLRIKGFANIAGRPGQPLVVHAVQVVFHPPIFLDEWPSDDHRTRLVFILRDIHPSIIDETLQILRHKTDETNLVSNAS